MIRNFEITDQDDRLLLTLPLREVLDTVRTGARSIPHVVHSVSEHWRRTQTLAATCREQVNDVRQAIEATYKTMEQTKRFLSLFRSPQPGE